MASSIAKFAHLHIPLEEVLKATNNFHDDNIMRHGEFGRAYKGRLLWSGRLMEIAAQRFDCKHWEGDLQFLTEISVLLDLKHTNLVSIIGFCDEKDEKIIVTTYEADRTLGRYLKNPSLTWTQRLRICVGVAHALSYLQYNDGRGDAIIHCNINSDAILLDENSGAKLVYYNDQVCLCEHNGTMAGMDPTIEKTRDVSTHKSHIYSFGVVLFEILCGRKAFIQNETNAFLTPLAKHHYENKTLRDIIHADLYDQMSPLSLLKYSNVAYSCLNEDPAHHPNMNYIVGELEKALELQLQREHIRNNFEHLKVPLDNIKSATHNFSDTYRCRFHDGCNWYRAELNHFNREYHPSEEGKNKVEHPKRHNTVIIKRYDPKIYGEEVMFTEMEILANVKHHNIITLLGFCVEGCERILVTENVSNGYLYDYLDKDRRIFTWEKRLRICVDVAHALNYIHYEMKDQKLIINRHINSKYIALDNNLRAKIVDFRHSVFLPPNQEDEALYLNIVGQRLFIDPEYKKTGKVKRESDVYSFGVILFEILSGRHATGLTYLLERPEGPYVAARTSLSMEKIVKMIDPIINEETGENNFVQNREPNKDSLNTFIEITFRCLAKTQDQRPTMKVVVKELEKALSFQITRDD